MSNRPKVANIAEVYPLTIKEVLYECLLPAIAKKHGLYGPAACSAILQATKLLQTDIDELASLPPEPVPTKKNKAKVPSAKRTKVGRPPKAQGERPAWAFIIALLMGQRNGMVFSELAGRVRETREAFNHSEVTDSTVRAALTRLCQDGFAVRGGKKKGSHGLNRAFLYKVTPKGEKHLLTVYPNKSQKGSRGMRTP